MSVRPSEDSINDYMLVESRSDGLVLERQDDRIDVQFPDLDITMAASPGDELRVERWDNEAPWISIRRTSNKELLFQAGFAQANCGTGDVLFCPVPTGAGRVCRFEPSGGASEAEVEFVTDDGPVRLAAGEGAEVIIEGRRFYAEAFFARTFDTSSQGDVLTAFSQSILVALE